jgi:hypothetical protein
LPSRRVPFRRAGILSRHADRQRIADLPLFLNTIEYHKNQGEEYDTN